MTQYNQPPTRDKRDRENEEGTIPWLWLGLGVVATFVGILFSFLFMRAMLLKDPLVVGQLEVGVPTVIRLTAVPSSIPSPTSSLPTPSPIPTLTPYPTPDLSTPPPDLTVGYYARVVGTSGFGVSIRAGPTTDNLRLGLANEDEIVLILDGPELGVGFSWWQIQLENGIEGWVVADYLVPAGKPNN